VLLVSSRDYVLPSFGLKLRDYALDATRSLGVRVMLGERPNVQKGFDDRENRLLLGNGDEEAFDPIVN
jgi:NADH dehydrogenase FAD-containing subunit